MKKISTFLKDTTISRGITIRELSERLGYSGNSFVSNVLNNRKSLPVGCVDKWAEALQLNADELELYHELCLKALAPMFIKVIIKDLRKKNASLAAIIRKLD